MYSVILLCAVFALRLHIYLTANNIGIIAEIVIGGLVFVILSIVAAVLLICLFSSSKTCRLPWTHFAVLLSLPFVPLTPRSMVVDKDILLTPLQHPKPLVYLL